MITVCICRGLSSWMEGDFKHQRLDAGLFAPVCTWIGQQDAFKVGKLFISFFVLSCIVERNAIQGSARLQACSLQSEWYV